MSEDQMNLQQNCWLSCLPLVFITWFFSQSIYISWVKASNNVELGKGKIYNGFAKLTIWVRVQIKWSTSTLFGGHNCKGEYSIIYPTHTMWAKLGLKFYLHKYGAFQSEEWQLVMQSALQTNTWNFKHPIKGITNYIKSNLLIALKI
jgi:hypothetical protein